MRKVGDLMKDLGFREDASDDVKEAFIKNLIRAAYGVEVKSPREKANKQKVTAPQPPQQLSFSFEPKDPVEGLFPKKKTS